MRFRTIRFLQCNSEFYRGLTCQFSMKPLRYLISCNTILPEAPLPLPPSTSPAPADGPQHPYLVDEAS